MALDPARPAGTLVRQFTRDPARLLALVQAVWPVAVGSALAGRTRVEGLAGQTLRVRVPDAAWRRTLHRMQPQVLARLRDLLGEAAPRRLGFSEGGLPEPEPTPPPAAAPAPAPLPGIVVEAAARIPDAEIRTLFERSAARALGARARRP